MPMLSTMRGVGALAAGLAFGYQLLIPKTDNEALLRPPGALAERDFLARCIRCGKCGLVCPDRIVKFDAGVTATDATPRIDAREGACRLCADFPCIAACPTGALSPIESREAVRMGTAVIDRDRCLSLKGMRCEVCYRVCPFIDSAIHIKYYLREGDSIHAIFEPVVNADHCTGCGICVERCPISDPPAILIKPR